MTGPGTSDPVRIGFFGKLPSRGDFVRVGLSRALASAWDGWFQGVIPKSHEGEAAMRSAPVWRFGIGAGVCGPCAACGVLLPSIDRVGRAFPLLVAAEAATETEAFLDAAEEIGADAIRRAMAPELLARQLMDAPRPLPASNAGYGARWWRRIGAGSLCLLIGDTLPDAPTFLRMLSR